MKRMFVLLLCLMLGSTPVAKSNPTKEVSMGANKIPVLLYHHIVKKENLKKSWEKNCAIITAEQFKKEMKYLHDNNFYTATLQELNDFINNKITLPKKTVVITFDDGYLSNLIYAYPILKEYNFKATIFTIGNMLPNKIEEYDYSRLQYINIPMMKDYKDVFEFQCHTYNSHYIKDNRGALMSISNDDITLDLTKNKSLLEAKYFSYPYGDYNSNIVKILEELEYELAFTVNTGYVTKNADKYKLPRFPIYPYTRFRSFQDIVLGKK